MAWFWLKIRKKMPSQTKSPNESRVLSPFFLLYFYFFYVFFFIRGCWRAIWLNVSQLNKSASSSSTAVCRSNRLAIDTAKTGLEIDKLMPLGQQRHWPNEWSSLVPNPNPIDVWRSPFWDARSKIWSTDHVRQEGGFLFWPAVSGEPIQSSAAHYHWH